jgi:signal transduction histidine kinase
LLKKLTRLVPISPALIFLIIALTTFIAESLVMLLLHYLPEQDYLQETLLDATLLVILISPTLYFMLFRALVAHIQERTRKLTQLNAELAQTLEDLKAAQDQLVHQEKMASLGQLVAGVAHELNNPIGFIYANFPHLEKYTNTLLALIEDFRKLPLPEKDKLKMEELCLEARLEFLRKDLPKIIKSGESGAIRVRTITAALRNFAHMDELEVSETLLEREIDDTLEMLQYQLNSGINIVRNYNMNIPVWCQAGQFNQVFMNILYNAIQAITVPGTITIGTRVENGWGVITISDSGCGIPPDNINRIFDPFFTTKKVGEGTGLGLSISYGIVKDHGGRIEVASEAGRGTTFSIYIPLEKLAGSFQMLNDS